MPPAAPHRPEPVRLRTVDDVLTLL